MSFEVGSVVFYDKGLTKGLPKGQEKAIAIVYNINPTGVFTIKYLNESREVVTREVDTNVIRLAVTGPGDGSHKVIENVENKDDVYFSNVLHRLNSIKGGNRKLKRRKSRRHKKTNRRRKSKRYKTNRYHRKY